MKENKLILRITYYTSLILISPFVSVKITTKISNLCTRIN